jgi:hypothetical protein
MIHSSPYLPPSSDMAISFSSLLQVHRSLFHDHCFNALIRTMFQTRWTTISTVHIAELLGNTQPLKYLHGEKVALWVATSLSFCIGISLASRMTRVIGKIYGMKTAWFLGAKSWFPWTDRTWNSPGWQKWHKKCLGDFCQLGELSVLSTQGNKLLAPKKLRQ